MRPLEFECITPRIIIQDHRDRWKRTSESSGK